MKVFIKLGFFLFILVFLTGCHTMVLIHEEKYEDEEEEVEEYVEPSLFERIMLDLTPFIFRELIFAGESHPHHLPPPVIHGNKGPEGNPTHTDNQRSTQTGRGSADTGNQTENRSSSGQSTRDSGTRRSGQ